ncbi:HMA domain-containing protein [Balamuthia mandrillaris]
MAASRQVEFSVDMMCGGCEKAVTAVLSKVPGVTSVRCDHQKNQVITEGTASVGDMLAAIAKTGKTHSLVREGGASSAQ